MSDRHAWDAAEKHLSSIIDGSMERLSGLNADDVRIFSLSLQAIRHARTLSRREHKIRTRIDLMNARGASSDEILEAIEGLLQAERKDVP